MLSRNPSENGLSVDHEPMDDGLGQTPVEPATPTTAAGQAAAKMKKLEAVRLALESGRDNTKEGVAWIKHEFDLDIHDATFNNYKSTLKNKAKKDEDLETLGEILRRGNLNLVDVL